MEIFTKDINGNIVKQALLSVRTHFGLFTNFWPVQARSAVGR